MPTAINVFRKNGGWRYATYIQGELSRLGSLDVAPDATEAAAMDAAAKMYAPFIGGVTVVRAADMPAHASRRSHVDEPGSRHSHGSTSGSDAPAIVEPAAP